MIKITEKEMLHNLVEIGYSNKELSKYLNISEQTISKILNNHIFRLSSKTKNSIISFFNKNIKKIDIGSIEKLNYDNSKFLIYTPDGFQKSGQFIKKGILLCYKIETCDFSLICSENHRIQIQDKKTLNLIWKNCKTLNVDDLILTENGFQKLLSIKQVGRIECVDIEIFHENHRYFTEGISSHNTGKTLVALLALANALNQNKFDKAFIFDGEGGSTKRLMRNLGIDLKSIEYITVKNVEDASTKLVATYDTIAEIQKEFPEFRAECMLDSLGSLVTRKAIKDMTDDEAKLDRGLRARFINDMSKIITIPMLETGCGLILLNHIYDDPNANPMYPTKIKNMSGGRGIKYMNRLAIQCTKSFTRDEDKESGHIYKTTSLNFMTTKNYLVVPFLETEIEIDFSKGFVSPYCGLLDLAKKYGYIKEFSSQSVIVPSYDAKAKIKNAEILYSEKSKEIWDTFIKDLNEKQKKDIEYSSFTEQTYSSSEGDEVVVDEAITKI